MNFQRKPIVILDIDQTLFNRELFKERIADANPLDKADYIELLYLTEKKLFQELVIKRNIPINIFSTQKKLINTDHTFNDTEAAKRLKDYLEDYKDYQIYFVDDQIISLTEAKKFNEDIITILLQTKEAARNITKYNEGADHIIQKLEDLVPIIPAN